MLESVYKSYLKSASEIGWEKYNCNDLFFEYIKHEGEPISENYYAGIVCRYWGYSGRVYNQMFHNVPFDQCYDLLIDTINYVLKNRVWEKETSKLYNDPVAPDKAFHVAIKRFKSIMLKKIKAGKRQSEYMPISIDSYHEEYSDAADGMLNISSEGDDPSLRVMVGEFFDKEKYIEAASLDYICFGNYDKFKYTDLTKYLRGLNDKCYFYYKSVYNITKEDYNKLVNEVKNNSYRMVSMKVKRLLYKMKGAYE